jgi:hypothetical protein
MKISWLCAAFLVAIGAVWGCAQGADVEPVVGKAGASAAGGAGVAGSAGTAASSGSAGKGGAAGQAGTGAGGAGGTAGSGGDCHAVINEIMTGTNASASNEFVEIFNPCSSTLQLSGWQLVYRSASGTSDNSLYAWTSGSIGAGSYALIGGTGWTGSTPDGTLTSGLGSSGGGVGLADDNATLVDSMGYGSATNSLIEGNAAAAPSGGGSVGRSPNGVDTDDNSADFASFDSPTPGAENL